MISDLDIYRSANVLLKHHGKDALIEAAMRADAMLDKADLDGLRGVAADTAGYRGDTGDGA